MCGQVNIHYAGMWKDVGMAIPKAIGTRCRNGSMQPQVRWVHDKYRKERKRAYLHLSELRSISLRFTLHIFYVHTCLYAHSSTVNQQVLN